MKRMFASLVSAGSLMVVAADQTTCTASVAPKADAAIIKTFVSGFTTRLMFFHFACIYCRAIIKEVSV